LADQLVQCDETDAGPRRYLRCRHR
jgi:hypothetical protein